MKPTAARVAIIDPVSAPIKVQVIIVATATPPGIRETKLDSRLTNAFDAPLWIIRLPARTNSAPASNTKLFIQPKYIAPSWAKGIPIESRIIIMLPKANPT